MVVTPRQTAALVKLKKFGNSLDENDMRDTLYALVQDCPGLWKNPRYVGQGGSSVIIRANDAGEDVAMKFALPIVAEDARKSLIFDFLNKIEKKKKSDIKEEFEARFKRGCTLQSYAYKLLRKKGLQKYGYIPEIYSNPRHDSVLFYTMQYIDAMSLIDYCKKSTYDEILQLYRNIIFFVNECLHKNAIVHSDLKPDNILVTPSGLPVVIDFDLAKNIVDNEQDVTHHLSVLGNQKWISPQQAGLSKARGRKDDIYTLGFTFWSMIVREIPQLPAGLTLHEDVKIHELFSVSRIPNDLEPFRDFFMKATSPESDMRFPNLDVAIENFDRSYNFWCKKNNTVVQQHSTTIVNQVSRIDWDAAREGIKNKKLENALYDIVQGLELLFFGGKKDE